MKLVRSHMGVSTYYGGSMQVDTHCLWYNWSSSKTLPSSQAEHQEMPSSPGYNCRNHKLSIRRYAVLKPLETPISDRYHHQELPTTMTSRWGSNNQRSILWIPLGLYLIIISIIWIPFWQFFPSKTQTEAHSSRPVKHISFTIHRRITHAIYIYETTITVTYNIH